MNFAQRCQAYRELAAQAPVDPESLAAASSAVISSLEHVGLDAIRAEVPSLLRLVDADDPYVAARTALVLGAFVEADLPPLEVCGHVLRRYRQEAELGRDYYALLRKENERLDTTGERSRLAEGQTLRGGDYAVEHRFAQAAAERLPRAAAAYFASDTLWLPVIACLTRDTTLRAEARADAELRDVVREYRADHARWLHALLAGVSDEEWVVLHIPSRHGFVVRVRELVDNFAIQPLLADALSAALGLEPPPAEVLACLRGEGEQLLDETVEGLFETYTHKAIAPTGALVEQLSEHHVWNEGLPEDIPRVGEHTVVVLGDRLIPRSWQAQRAFGPLGSHIELVRTMSPVEYEAWIARCSSGTLH